MLCEKPLDRRPEEVERAFDLAERLGLVFAEAFMWRHHPQTARVAELVSEGAIGRLRAVRAVFAFRLSDPANIRMRPELDGGALMDLGCYCVSGARLFAGEPERCSGEQILAETGVDAAFHGTLAFPGDVVAQFEASFLAPFQQRLEAIGEDGVIEIGAPWLQSRPGDVLLRRGDEVERIEIAPAHAYGRELEDFAAAVRGDGTPLLGRDDALGQARAIDALYRAAEEGRAVAFSAARGEGRHPDDARDGAGLAVSQAPRVDHAEVRALDAVERVQLVVRPARVGGARDVPARAVVGDDHPVALERPEDDPRLRREAPHGEVGAQPEAQAHRRQVRARRRSRRSAAPGRRRRGGSGGR